MADLRPALAAARIAAAHGGAVSHAQLLAVGLSPEQVKRWARSGRLLPRHEGVFALGRPIDDAFGAAHAAVLAVGEDAVVSHASLQALLQVTTFDPRARPHVSVPRRSGVHPEGIVVHRLRRLDERDVTVVRGLRCTTPARLLLDEAERLRAHELRRLVRELKAMHLLPPGAVEDVVSRAAGRRGCKLLRQVWDGTSAAVARTASPAEVDLLDLCRRHGLPEPLVNEPVRGLERRWRADALFVPEQLVVEIDSRRWHDFDDAFEEDRRKDEDLRAVGMAVVRFTASRASTAPEAVAAAIHRELEVRRRLLGLGWVA